MGNIEDIREVVQDAYEELEDLDCDLMGLYNYIRYGNEEFCSDMIVNESKPISDNSKTQHYYLVFFIWQALQNHHDIPKEFIALYKKNREKYNDDMIQMEIEYIEEKLEDV